MWARSITFGWDDRWGMPIKVSAVRSLSSGTVRSCGLDCSGFVTWIFVNIYGEDGINEIGRGCTAQWNSCAAIKWSEVRPGDLVFYPDNKHCGIVAGRENSGNLLICHCAGGVDNLITRGVSGFTKIGRPAAYRE